MLARLREYAKDSSKGIEVDELSFERKDTQLEIAKRADRVIIGGGDGTVSTIASALNGASCSVGVLPLGTGNDFARELGFEKNILLASHPDLLCNYYRSAPTKAVALWSFDYGEDFSSSVSFLNYVSMGFDAHVVHDFARWRASSAGQLARGVWLNRLGYSAAALRNIFKRLPSNLSLQSNDEDFSITSGRGILFANIRSLMGLGISNPIGSPFDETIECIVVHNIFAYLLMLLHYRIPFFMPDIIESRKTWEMRNLPAGIAFQIDGEPRQDIRTSCFRIRKSHELSFIVPE